jgi:hypothetical protein
MADLRDVLPSGSILSLSLMVCRNSADAPVNHIRC